MACPQKHGSQDAVGFQWAVEVQSLNKYCGGLGIAEVAGKLEFSRLQRFQFQASLAQTHTICAVKNSV
jgi:hypothetical protein